MPQIIPMKELRNTNAISELCNAKQAPVFITKNGYVDLVIMSIKTYEKIIRSSHIDDAIASSEAELAAGGELLDAKTALEELRKKYCVLHRRS